MDFDLDKILDDMEQQETDVSSMTSHTGHTVPLKAGYSSPPCTLLETGLNQPETNLEKYYQEPTVAFNSVQPPDVIPKENINLLKPITLLKENEIHVNEITEINVDEKRETKIPQENLETKINEGENISVESPENNLVCDELNLIENKDIRIIENNDVEETSINNKVLNVECNQHEIPILESDTDNTLNIQNETKNFQINNKSDMNDIVKQEVEISDDYTSYNNCNEQIQISGINISVETEENDEILTSGNNLELVSSENVTMASMINIPLLELGKVNPEWVKDSDVLCCKYCDVRFTITKRRHHCRACGNIFCATCCSFRVKLQLNNNRECRVCSVCIQDINRIRTNSTTLNESKILQPQQQTNIAMPNGVLRKDTTQRNVNNKSVMFSDGVKPGGELTSLDGAPPPRPCSTSSTSRRLKKSMSTIPAIKSNSFISDKDNLLPPILVDGVFGERMNSQPIFEHSCYVYFLLNANLTVQVALIDLDCCLKQLCWVFSTTGMSSVGQPEVIIILKCLEKEKIPPTDIFLFLQTCYDSCLMGQQLYDLQVISISQPIFLESRFNCGFLLFNVTSQCMNKIYKPQSPYLVGLLIQRTEMIWGKLLPLRLLLRLGSEFRYYPCPLISVRDRKPVFGEVGNSIIKLLADVRNLQYTLTFIKGSRIHIKQNLTELILPLSSYDDIMKAMRHCDDQVFAMATDFSSEADTHLVCAQCLEDVDNCSSGSYSTQAINIDNRSRIITAGSFIVFNGSLKGNESPIVSARSIIVEDGVMVQLTNEALKELKTCLVASKEFRTHCSDLDEIVVIWMEDIPKQETFTIISDIDGKSLDSAKSITIRQFEDISSANCKCRIRWTNLFIIQASRNSDIPKLAETIANCSASALVQFSDEFIEQKLRRFSLRINVSIENVGFKLGNNGSDMQDGDILSNLDQVLVPTMYNALAYLNDDSIEIEFIFHVIE